MVAKKLKTIVDQLRQAMLDSGMTTYKIGKETGVGQPGLDRFIAGERDLRMGTAAKVAAFLGLELVNRK